MLISQELSFKGLTVTIRSDDKFFTVYNGDRIAGTIHRPMPDTFTGRKRGWCGYDINGDLIKESIGPRTVLMHMAKKLA